MTVGPEPWDAFLGEHSEGRLPLTASEILRKRTQFLEIRMCSARDCIFPDFWMERILDQSPNTWRRVSEDDRGGSGGAPGTLGRVGGSPGASPEPPRVSTDTGRSVVGEWSKISPAQKLGKTQTHIGCTP